MTPRRLAETLAILFCPFSLFTALLLPQRSSSEQPSESKREDGVVAGPLADVRAPQRVSTPPSSGLDGGALIPSKTLDLTRPLLLLLCLGPTMT